MYLYIYMYIYKEIYIYRYTYIYVHIYWSTINAIHVCCMTLFITRSNFLHELNTHMLIICQPVSLYVDQTNDRRIIFFITSKQVFFIVNEIISKIMWNSVWKISCKTQFFLCTLILKVTMH